MRGLEEPCKMHHRVRTAEDGAEVIGADVGRDVAGLLVTGRGNAPRSGDGDDLVDVGRRLELVDQRGAGVAGAADDHDSHATPIP